MLKSVYCVMHRHSLLLHLGQSFDILYIINMFVEFVFAFDIVSFHNVIVL